MGGDGPAGYTRPTFKPLVTTPPTVLVVGAASRDVTAEDPRGWRLGGAVTYGALTLGRLGFRVRALVGVDREAASARELDLLRAAGVVITLRRARIRTSVRQRAPHVPSERRIGSHRLRCRGTGRRGSTVS